MRALHGAPPVEIDWDIALGAQKWADQMSATDNMTHSERGGRNNQGENLAMMTDAN